MRVSNLWAPDLDVALQVLHTRSCSGVGMHFLHFLAACYMVFSLEHESIAAALAFLPPLKTSVALQLGTHLSMPLCHMPGWCSHATRV